MILNSHFALNSVFRVESFSEYSLVLRHDCIFWRYKAYADRRGLLVRWCQIRVRSSKMGVFCFDRYIFRMKFPTGIYMYRNLHRFARFPCDSMALVLIILPVSYSLMNFRKVGIKGYHLTSSMLPHYVAKFECSAV